jgi:hypothetical protein
MNSHHTTRVIIPADRSTIPSSDWLSRYNGRGGQLVANFLPNTTENQGFTRATGTKTRESENLRQPLQKPMH